MRNMTPESHGLGATTDTRASMAHVRGGATAGAGVAAIVAAPREAAARARRALEVEGLSVDAHVGSPSELHELPAHPEVVVVLSEALGFDLVECTRAVAHAAPSARLVLVAHALSARTLRLVLAEGVDAIVLEQDLQRCLGLAARCALEGQLTFPESMRTRLSRPPLSMREKQVLGMVVLGMSNGEISCKLHISESTVKSHLSSSFRKLGVRSRNEAAQLILDPVSGLGSGILTIDQSA